MLWKTFLTVDRAGPNIFAKTNFRYNLPLKLGYDSRWSTPSNVGRNGHSVPTSPMAIPAERLTLWAGCEIPHDESMGEARSPDRLDSGGYCIKALGHVMGCSGRAFQTEQGLVWIGEAPATVGCQRDWKLQTNCLRHCGVWESNGTWLHASVRVHMFIHGPVQDTVGWSQIPGQLPHGLDV